jgi:hypothetical protein
MATRFNHKALMTAAVGIVLSLMLAAPTTASPASGTTAEATQLDPPAAPSNCKSTLYRDRRKGDYTVVSWNDNSTNEDGFTLEVWRRQSGAWTLAGSYDTAANSHAVAFGGRFGSDYKFRVKAFNASGDSAWSNWGH